MPKDSWNQDDAWAEPGSWDDAAPGDAEWAEDLRTGNAFEMRAAEMNAPQSGLGIASLVLSVIAGIMVIGTMVGAAVLVGQNPNLNENDPQIIGIGCGILFALLLAVIAGILGIIALFQPERSRTCALVGLLFSGLEVLGIGGIIAVGILAG